MHHLGSQVHSLLSGNWIGWRSLRSLSIILALGTGTILQQQQSEPSSARGLSLREVNGDLLVDLFADKVSGGCDKGDFDQTSYTTSARVGAAHVVVLAKKPTASTGERGGSVIVGARGMHLKAS